MLKELWGADRATGRHAQIAKDHLKHWEQEKESIDVNDVFKHAEIQDQYVHSMDNIIHSPSHFEFASPTNAQGNLSTGTSGSRGTKRKA